MVLTGLLVVWWFGLVVVGLFRDVSVLVCCVGVGYSSVCLVWG